MTFSHTPIMLKECIDGLNIKPDGVYVDCTIGGGGHSQKICSHLGKNGLLLGIDQDINAINAATQNLSIFSENTLLIRGNFFNIASILKSLNIEFADGFLVDLGVSSHQLDEPSRGFSYMHDAPLDMRMDTSREFSAYDVVNSYSADKLYKVIFEYGEERYAKRIARCIVNARADSAINTTYELVGIIKKAIPKENRMDGPHPAKRTFQAVRIEVNGELSGLSQSLFDMAALLKKGGRMCVISFHSLEDRIVKNAFKTMKDPCTCPIDFPVCVCGKKPSIELITKKPTLPSEDEILQNPRARSAKLRIIEKI